MSRLTGIVFILLCLGAPCFAQDAPKADVAAGFSALYILKGYTIWTAGGSASGAYYANNWLGLVGDFGVYHGYPAESLTGETYMGGPRFSYRRLNRVVPFGQALFGGSHFNASTGGITGGGSQFAFALGGGADFLLGHESKFALRPQLEYVGIRSQGSTTPSARLSIGFVYRIGK